MNEGFALLCIVSKNGKRNVVKEEFPKVVE